jgi:hypothetical protein
VVARGLARATDLYIERGAEDTRRGQSYEGMLALIDRVHALGLGVTLENYTAVDRFESEFELASYLLHSNGRDAFGSEWASCPRPSRRYRPCRARFWKGYRANLGRALGPRTLRPDGVLERRFQRGIALVNPPGAPARTAALDGLYRDLDGATRPFAGLAGGQALVLTR